MFPGRPVRGRGAAAGLAVISMALAACQTDGQQTGTATSVGLGVGAGVAAGYGADDDDDSGGNFGIRATMAGAVTTMIVERLRQIWRECEAQTAQEYHIDCLSEGYVRAAAIIPQDEVFGASRSVILQAAARLDSVTRQNQAAALPTVTTQGRTRPLRPIDPARRAAANAAALQIIEETRTVLLRSARTAPQRAAFQQIAEAVDSSKVLMRS
jgi:hypothetical protein